MTSVAVSSRREPLRRVADHRSDRYLIGSLLVFMAGCGSDTSPTGSDDASSDPGTGSWTALSAAPLASDRFIGAAAWNGKELFVWGGSEKSFRYVPDSDRWTSGAGNGGPYHTRSSPSVVWAGDRVILWGGDLCAEGNRLDAPCADGASYDPIKDTWQAITLNGAPSGRRQHTALWTGSRMVIWGRTGRAKRGPRSRGDGSTDDIAPDPRISARTEPPTRWLFVGSDEGGAVNATFTSLLASCRLCGVEPWAYLCSSSVSAGPAGTGRLALAS